MRIPIGKNSLEIVQGDITDQETDAIVNAANNHFWMGSGVAGAIKKKGGQQIESDAVAQGPVEVGGAVITHGGNLKAPWVIHAAGMGQDLKTDKDIVLTTTRASLVLAEQKMLKSIAFPAIGTGVGGLEMHLCAQIMLKESVNFLMKSKHCADIKFVLYDKTSFDLFEGELRALFSA